MTEDTKYKIIIEKEYYDLKKKPYSIGLLMMVKNEHKRIQVSLDSVLNHVDCFIIYDTGSTDNTMEIIQNHCEKHKINLYMIQGEFVNFCESRNVSLDYADTKDVTYLLLLDTNDELQGGEKLREFAKKNKDSKSTGFLTCQHWWSGQYDKYFNMRFVKAHSGWRYKGSVHEWMEDTSVKDKKEAPPVTRMPDDIVLYQDRTQDDDKSGKRFARDKILLLADHKKDPKEPRILFYLAQTCSCLSQNDDAFYYYKLRSKLEGFQEEKFHAFHRCGMISEKLGHNWETTLPWYMKALEHSTRAEPLVKIAEHYKNNKKWDIAFMFINMACNIKYPEHCILFVDKHSYDYTRWHLMGIIAYYCGQYKAGKISMSKSDRTGKKF